MQRRIGIALIAATVAVSVLVLPADAATSQPSTEFTQVPAKNSSLSPRLALLAEPSLASLSGTTRAARLALPPSGPGSLITSPTGQVLVYVRVATTMSAAAAAVRASGGTVVHESERYLTLTASMPPRSTPTLAASPAVAHVSEALAPVVGATRTLSRSLGRAPVVTCGTITSEGDDLLDAKAARDQYGIDGTGATVGVISDSYDRATFARRATTDVASGDLPGASNPCSRTTAVTVVDDGASGTDFSDEGRGMLQLVHDLAPGANLQFATGWRGLYEFADAVRNLGTSGSNIIVDDLAYLDEPTFQQGPISQAIADVTLTGVHYLTAVGNDNLIVAGRDVASWETPTFRGTPCPGAASETCLDFDPGANANAEREITLAPGGSIMVGMHWAQPWNGVTLDLDLFLFDRSTGSTLASSTDNNLTGGRPFELLSYTNSSASARVVTIAVPRYAGTARPRVKLILMAGQGSVTKVQYPLSVGGDIVGPTVYGHAGSPNATSVGAVAYNESVPESFSSRGPMTTYFGPVVGSSPAAATSPRVVQKPDLSATDGGGTTFFGQNVGGVARFYGTSAAAPHAAGIVALVVDYRLRNSLDALSPSAMRALIKSRATPMPGVPVTTGGTGLISAIGSLAVVPGQPGAATASAGSARATITWGATGDTGGAPLRRYSVTSSPAGARCVAATLPATSAVCTNLVNGTSYRFTVRAVNAAGSGPASVTDAVTPVGVPTAPQRLAVSFPRNGRAAITWRGPANSGGRSLLRYEYCLARCATTSNWRSTGGTPPALNSGITLINAVRGRSYSVSIRAVNSIGRGAIAKVTFIQQR